VAGADFVNYVETYSFILVITRTEPKPNFLSSYL